MNKQTFTKLLDKSDTWSNKTIQESFVGKLLSFFANKTFNTTNTKQNNILFKLLLTSISILFASLSLPQFANDRFGIGIVAMICFLIFALNVGFHNIKSIKFNSLDFLVIILFAIMLISTFSSYFLTESLKGLLKYTILFGSYFMLRFTIANCSKNTFLNLWSIIFFLGFIVAAIGIYQYIIGVQPLATWEDPNLETIHTRVYSTLGNPNLLAGYLLLILPVSIFIPLEMKFNDFYKFLFLTGSLTIFICIIFTGSRGGYLGLLSGIIFIAIASIKFLTKVFHKTNNKVKVLVAVLLTVGFYFLLTSMFPIVSERIATIFAFREHSSNSYRLNVWTSCLKILRDNWLIGVGPGNSTFRQVYGLYMISGFDALASYNIFLEIALETGIMGLIIFSLIFLTSFLKLHYMFWNKGNIFSLGIALSLIILLTHGMVDTVFFRPQVFIPFWFLLASIDKLDTEISKNSL